jgi:hypothetical protein
MIHEEWLLVMKAGAAYSTVVGCYENTPFSIFNETHVHSRPGLSRVPSTSFVDDPSMRHVSSLSYKPALISPFNNEKEASCIRRSWLGRLRCSHKNEDESILQELNANTTITHVVAFHYIKDYFHSIEDYQVMTMDPKPSAACVHTSFYTTISFFDN